MKKIPSLLVKVSENTHLHIYDLQLSDGDALDMPKIVSHGNVYLMHRYENDGTAQLAVEANEQEIIAAALMRVAMESNETEKALAIVAGG